MSRLIIDGTDCDALEAWYEQLSSKANTDPTNIPKLQQKGGVDAAAVAAALPYKDSKGQPVFCHVLSAAEVRGEQLCIVCKASVKVKSMREHVGSHVLQGHVSGDACGFCGGPSCTPCLKEKSQPGQPKDCTGYVNFSTGPCKKDRPQCNNHPVKCSECQTVVWTYGMAAHYAAKHPQLPKPQPPFEKGSKEEKHMLAVAKSVHAPK